MIWSANAKSMRDCHCREALSTPSAVHTIVHIENVTKYILVQAQLDGCHETCGHREQRACGEIVKHYSVEKQKQLVMS